MSYFFSSLQATVLDGLLGVRHKNSFFEVKVCVSAVYFVKCFLVLQGGLGYCEVCLKQYLFIRC